MRLDKTVHRDLPVASLRYSSLRVHSDLDDFHWKNARHIEEVESRQAGGLNKIKARTVDGSWFHTETAEEIDPAVMREVCVNAQFRRRNVQRREVVVASTKAI